MKKVTIIVILMICALGANAQLRHVSGNRSFGLGWGSVADGEQLNINYRYLFKKNMGYRFTLAKEKLDFDSSLGNIYYLNPEFLYTFKVVGQKLFLNLKGGAIIGHEDTENNILNEDKSQFCYGENVGVFTEYYLTPKLLLNLEFDQRLFQHSLFGQGSYLFKITLNFEI